MQDFFKETSLREKLQEQCDDLNREVDRLQTTNTKLKKQLVDAQTAIAEKDKAVAGQGGDSTGWDEKKHNTIVDGMEKKFALETKLLEEQKQKLKEEKRVAQEKEAVEAAKAAELQQVLDDLNVELERQGREWDAEKLQLVEQRANIEALTKEVTVLKEERDTLSADLATANSTLESLQTKLGDLEKSHSEEVQVRNDEIDTLTRTVETLRSEVTAAEQRHSDASEEAKRSLESKSSELSKVVEELQAKMSSLQQQHTDELRNKDEAIASHMQTEKELQEDLTKLQQRADQTTSDLESERTAHAETLKAKISEIQESSQSDLKAKEADIANHLKSIEDLQSQITSLQQGETDGARVSQELTKQIEELKTAHEEAIGLKEEQNEELTQQLEAINDQLSSDATEIEQLKEEADSLRKTVESLEQTSQQDNARHTTTLEGLRTELNEAKKKADSYKADLDNAQDRHRQDLRVLGEDHDAEIDSLRADLEGDAKKRLDKLQAEYDALVAEKNAVLEGHEKSLAERAKELEETKKEISGLKQRSGSTSQGLDEAIAKHRQVLDEKTALAEAHYTAQKQVADLEAQVKTLIEDNQRIGELQAQLNASTEENQSMQEALLRAESTGEDLQAKLDALNKEKQAIEEDRDKTEQALVKIREELDDSVQKQQVLEQQRTALEKSIVDLEAQHRTLSDEKTAMDESHARTVEALKADTESVTTQALNELQSKHDSLLEEKRKAEDSHAAELGDIQTKCDSLVAQLSDIGKKLEESTTHHTAAEEAHAKALDKALESQRQEIEQKYVVLLEEVQADATKLEQEKTTALADKQSLVNEHETTKSELHAQIDDLKHELAEKEEIDSAGLVEVSKKYETLLTEQATADKEAHEAAIEDLRASLREEYERAKHEACMELEDLKEQLASKEQADSAGLAEVAEKYESLLAEQSAADKRDHEASMALFRDSADTDLNETKERYEALLAEKDSLSAEFERAKDEAYAEIDELRRELASREQSSATDGAEATKKYETLLAEKTAADEAHEAALSDLKQSLKSEREQALAELQAQNSALQEKFAKMDESHQETLQQLKRDLEEGHSTNSEALRRQLESAQKQHTDATEQMVKAHEDAISELMVGMQNSAADAVQQLQKEFDALEAELETVKANHIAELEAIQKDGTDRQQSYNDLKSRFDRAVADVEASSEDVKRLQETIEAIEAERDRAYKAAVEAEDRIETFKGEVVRKHLARVEPLQKENTALLNKIDRLQDMLAAGDRIARAAASMGEKREMNTLAEESEEEQDSSASRTSIDSAPPVPPKAPLRNGAAKDVVGTVSFPQCSDCNV